jgi:DNA-binding MarR family transcriptional regulator
VSTGSSERTGLLDEMQRAGRQLSAATIMFHQAVADRLGLNPTDHKCIDLLALKGLMTAGELAEATGLTTGAITGVIDRLEGAGYVRREDDPNDRRRVIVRVVSRRYREIGRLFEGLSAKTAELGARYSDRELATILDFMSRSHKMLHAATLELRQEASSADRRRSKPEKTRGRRSGNDPGGRGPARPRRPTSGSQPDQ